MTKSALPSGSTVYVGMSGGVDSSVAAMLLIEQGYNVVGVYMKNWSEDLPGMKCPWAEDLADAKRVAVKLGIPFEVWDFEAAYRDKVVEYMLDEFRRGNTPNPDIMCNQEIKFKLFYERARAAGADFIATGHYARVAGTAFPETEFDAMAAPVSHSGPRPSGVDFIATGHYARAVPVSQLGAFRSAAARELAREPRGDGRERRGPEWNTSATITQTSSQDTDTALLRAVDENKDQTYFLYRISDEALMHTIFPIGGMMKPDVKKLAAERGLHNAYKKESMGVCFVGEVGMKDFLKGYIDVEPGEIREAENERVLGYHEGAVFYTIGQRHGLYLSGVAGEVNDGLPYYVVAKDIKNNIVYVSKNLNHEAVWATELELRDVIVREPAAQGQVLARLRHRCPLIPATFDGKTLKFENAIKRPATGQSAVLYDGEVCLGGGIITA